MLVAGIPMVAVLARASAEQTGTVTVAILGAKGGWHKVDVLV